MRDDQKRRAIQLIHAIKTRGSTVSLDAVADLLNELLWEEAAPDGWKLVPEKPTVDMIVDGLNARYIGGRCDEGTMARRMYTALLAAAPEAPAVQEKRGLPEPAALRGFSRDEWHDKAWALYHSQTFDDTMLAKVNVHTIRKVFDTTFNALINAPAVQADLVKDAERYRYLRACNSGSLMITHLIGIGDCDEIVLTGNDADEAIDAAIAAEKGGHP